MPLWMLREGLDFGIIEPGHEKNCLRGFRQDKTQTGLPSYRDKLESWIVMLDYAEFLPLSKISSVNA